jgi:hypothetical protein
MSTIIAGPFSHVLFLSQKVELHFCNHELTEKNGFSQFWEGELPIELFHFLGIFDMGAQYRPQQKRLFGAFE